MENLEGQIDLLKMAIHFDGAFVHGMFSAAAPDTKGSQPRPEGGDCKPGVQGKTFPHGDFGLLDDYFFYLHKLIVDKLHVIHASG